MMMMMMMTMMMMMMITQLGGDATRRTPTDAPTVQVHLPWDDGQSYQVKSSLFKVVMIINNRFTFPIFEFRATTRFPTWPCTRPICWWRAWRTPWTSPTSSTLSRWKKNLWRKIIQNLNDILKPFPVGCWHSLEALHGPDGTLSNSYIFITKCVFPPVFIMATARNTEFGKKKVHTSPPLVTMQENEKARPSRLSGAPNVVQSCQLVKVVDCAEWLCACAPQLSDPCECGIQARPPNG